MGEAGTIGFDIAKSVFQVHGVDVAGAVVIRKRVTRSKVLEYFWRTAAMPGRDRSVSVGASLRQQLSILVHGPKTFVSRNLWTTVCRTTSRIDAPNQLRKA